MAQPAKVATPELGVTGFDVQVRTALLGFVPIARATLTAGFAVTTLLVLSWRETTGCWDHAVLVTPPPGWVVKNSLVAAVVIPNELLVALVRLPLEAVIVYVPR